jgi:hypothetical protein
MSEDAMNTEPERVAICATEDWKHVCHLNRGHHGPHACTAPEDVHGCDFTWPNENESTPCQSNTVAVLGALEPSGARLRCGLLEGHQGAHCFTIEWTGDV